MRIAYATPDACGTGHAARGAALALAGRRAGVEVRALGPVPSARTTGAAPPPEFEGRPDWREAVEAWRPDVLVGDLSWALLEPLRLALAVPSLLLVRYAPRWTPPPGGWRAVGIEPLAAGLPESVGPVVGAQRLWPPDGARLHAGYNTWWEACAHGYRDRVEWVRDGDPEREARIGDTSGAPACDGADAVIAMALSC